MAVKKYKLLTVNFYLMFKWRICYTEMINFLQFKISVRKSHSQPRCTSELIYDCRLFIPLNLSSRFFYSASSIKKIGAKNSSLVYTFVLLTSPFIEAHKQKKYRSQLWGFRVPSVTIHNDTHVRMNFFSQLPSISPSKI